VAYAYTGKNKKTEVPFGHEPVSSPLLREIPSEDASLKDSAVGFMSQTTASGTMSCYANAAKKSENFCSEKGYKYPDSNEKAVMHFVIQQDNALHFGKALVFNANNSHKDKSDIMLKTKKSDFIGFVFRAGGFGRILGDEV